MAIWPKAIYMFNEILTKIPMTFITETEKIYPKVHLETQETTNSQGNTQQKEQCLRYHTTWLQTILQSDINKNSMVLAPKQTWRPVEQNSRPRYKSTQLCPPYFWQRHQKHMISACRKLKLDPCLSPCTSINSKWIKDLNIRPKTLKLVQKWAGNFLEANRYRQGLLH
jgi:hypothetical protein